MSLTESTVFVIRPSEVELSPPVPTKAYDVRHDFNRYHELCFQYSDTEARQILLQEMTADLATHFAELNRVKAFSYRYLITDGNLVEDSPAKKPIADMFVSQDNVTARLWTNAIVPTLESMPIGATVFTYSARQESKYEGGYDYAYIFQKVDDYTIHCCGIELVLNRADQAAIINRLHLVQQQPLAMLTQNPQPDEVRGQAFYFPPSHYQSIAHAYTDILEPIASTQPHLRTQDSIEDHLNHQQTLLIKQKQRASKLAKKMLQAMLNPTSTNTTASELLATHQTADIYRLYADEIHFAKANGLNQILLPCGYVDLVSNMLSNGDIRFTAGTGLVETTTWSYHTGTCRHCHAINTDVGPCEICKQCEKIL